MKVRVVWRNYLDGVQARFFWDQSLLEWMFAQRMPGGYTFDHSDDYPSDPTEGCVVVMPGHTRNNDVLNEDIRQRKWILLIVTSDEEGDYPFWGLFHPNLSLWKHTPRSELPWQPDRALPLGWTPGTVEANQSRPVKSDDWFFAGQITHGRREEAAQVMRTMGGGKLVETDHFLAVDEMNHAEYLDMMRRAKTVPCPSGPNIPDSFRFYEALESGAVPLADATCPRGDWGYWHRVFGPVPFPVVEDWSTLPALVEEYRSQDQRVKVLAWWEQAKRDLIWRLHDDIANLKSREAFPPPNVERITALVSSSPIPSHPSTGIIEQTVNSIRERLPLAEIIIMQDGIRPEQESYREAYTEYLERLVWLCRKWRAIPLIFEDFQHQANMTRRGLEMVRNDLVLFVEHDTPLVGDIPFDALGHFVMAEDFHLIRFHHEQAIPREHMYLMKGKAMLKHKGSDYRIMATRQWSQRPHLARTQFYRNWIRDSFPVTDRTYIEDRIYGVVESQEWDKFKLGIFTPKGNIQRSTHLDGRAGDSKFGF